MKAYETIEVETEQTDWTESLTKTAGILASPEVSFVMDVIKTIYSMNDENSAIEKMVRQVCQKVEKIINEAFLKQNKERLKAAELVLLNYARNPNSDWRLLHLDTLMPELFFHFENEDSLEGQLCAIQSANMYMLTLKALASKNPNEINNVKENGEMLKNWSSGAAEKIYSILESSVGRLDCNKISIDNSRNYAHQMCMYFDSLDRKMYWYPLSTTLKPDEIPLYTSDETSPHIKAIKPIRDAVYEKRKLEAIKYKSVVEELSSAWGTMLTTLR